MTSEADAPAADAIATVVSGAAGAISSVFNCLLEGPVDCLIFAVMSIILGFSTFLLGIAGVLFNLVVIKTVFQFSLVIGNSAGVLIAWGILRDIGNMVLLFGFVFIGIATILDIGGVKYAAKRTLPRLVIFAVLMNFSLFAAEAVIDTSNVFSAVMYRQANNAPCLSDALSSSGGYDAAVENTEACANVGIAGSFMKATGLAGMFNVGEMGVVNTSVYLMLSLFAIIGAFVLFAASIMLVIRAVTLTFLMITSPIGFAGAAIPSFEKFATDWWNKLIHQAFFAPILLLLIFISLKIAEGFTAGLGNRSLAAALTQPNSSVMGVILVFSLVIGFMIASLIAAKKFGAMGADYAVKTAGGLALGTTGWAGRQTAGRLANRYDTKIRNSKFGQTRLGRRVAGFTERGATASFDLRNTKAATLVGKGTGNLGKGQSGGYQGDVKKKAEAYKKYADTLGPTREDKEEEERLAQERADIDKQIAEEQKRHDDTKAKLGERRNREDSTLAEEEKRAQEEINAQRTAAAKARERRKQEMRLQEGKLLAAVRGKNAKLSAKQKEEQDRLIAEEERKLQELAAAHEQKEADEETAIRAQDETLKGIKGRRKAVKDRYDEYDRQLGARTKEIRAGLNARKKQIREELSKIPKRSKERFADNLENSRIPISGPARRKAAGEIRKKLNRSKEEEGFDKIKEAIEKAGKGTKSEIDELQEAIKETGRESRREIDEVEDHLKEESEKREEREEREG
jgi:hypothetical protein